MGMSGGCGRRRLQVICADIRRWLRMGAAYCTEPVGRRMRCLKSFIFNRQRAGQAEAQKQPESRENQENSYGSWHLFRSSPKAFTRGILGARATQIHIRIYGASTLREFCTCAHRFAQGFDQNLIDAANGKLYLARQIEPGSFRTLRINLEGATSLTAVAPSDFWPGPSATTGATCRKTIAQPSPSATTGWLVQSQFGEAEKRDSSLRSQPFPTGSESPR